MRIKITKGLNIPLAGQPQQHVEAGHTVAKVALLGADYVGLKPRLIVETGQAVGLGEPLFFDKRDPAAPYTSPGTGRVVEINRGRRRRLQSVVIQLDENAASETIYSPGDSQDAAAIRGLLLQSGLWAGFRSRPYNRVPHSSSTPRSIFVTAIDTRPLAANPGIVIARRESEFEKGMETLSRFNNCPVYLCTSPNWSGPGAGQDGVRHVEFAGPHPAGLPGTHIHHLDPVAADRTVWHINYQDVIAIGHLFSTGRLLTERIVSIAGPGVLKPRLVSTVPGADLRALMAGEVADDIEVRMISGSVLDGATAEGPVNFIGRYHHQVSVLPVRFGRRPFGWLFSEKSGFSAAGLFASFSGTGRLRDFSMARNGRMAAMMPVEAFEQVMPLDILPAPLLRALLVKDTVAAQALGCLELAEEDLALSSFVCPAKLDYGSVLRQNLDQIDKEG